MIEHARIGSALLNLANALLASQTPTILMRIIEVHGSTPREDDAWMLVTQDKNFGTIGGGQLEFFALGEAQKMLIEGSQEPKVLDIPLGPLFGQCCGGRVIVSLARLDEHTDALLRAQEKLRAAAQPHILICGAGHTGQALANALAPLPFSVTLADDRANPEPTLSSHLIDSVDIKLRIDLEATITAMPSDAAYIILTHNHCLDYRLTEVVLQRQDARYVGMIGSKTKRARFASYLRQRYEQNDMNKFLHKLTCPIGMQIASPYRKYPAVIAALTVTDILEAFATSANLAKKNVTHAA